MVLLAPMPSSSAAGPAVWFHGDLGQDPWFAIRFNITPDTDLNILGFLYTSLGGEERNGGVTFVIQDGKGSWQLSGPGGVSHNWWTDMHWGHVATPLARATVGSETENALYDNFFFGGGTPGLRAQRSVTFVGIADAAGGYYSANATWTRGVVSYDVAKGSAIVKQADQMQLGVHAGSYSWLAPRAAAGALLTESFQTERDFFGWFLPENNDSSIVSRWSCTEDGVACPPRGWGDGDTIGLIPLVSKGPTQWDFAIDATLETFPSVVIGAVELPGDDYLVDTT